ncbi:hypothetical protein M9H77_22706 [Catharanthus roseus]|uniref:Uncharacterized protein n=1 Tax=Catharanthus roseus TaxID=4058 RepID=A0ACC0AVB2_CATRO|nr:hypothetical protein M9H77_22706 [Catharanthus roseus]
MSVRKKKKSMLRGVRKQKEVSASLRNKRVKKKSKKKDKVQLVIESFTSSVLAWWKYIREHRWRNGRTPTITWESLKRVLKETLEVLRVEESSRGITLPQAKIEIEGSVEVHVEKEMSKEDFCDSMSDMSFEEEESIEIERKDRVEEKERLVKKSSSFVYISSLDLLNKSIRRNVERCSYMISSFETFVIAVKGISPFKNRFLNAEVQLESHCVDHKLLIGIEDLKAFLIEAILGLQFYPLHFE